MRISFFEEFPTPRNLGKLQYLRWPTKLYLAASSVTEFKRLVKRVSGTKVQEAVYWPTLQKKEGYWISPFAAKRGLRRIFAELQKSKIPVMLDLELPTAQNPSLYVTQALNFWVNRRLIQHFIDTYRGEVYLCEYFPEGRWSEAFLKILGLHYPSPNAIIIKMIYTSMHAFPKDFILRELKRGKADQGKNFIAAYGLLIPGIVKSEEIIAPKQLLRDLRLAGQAGVSEVILYRLGGLNKEYIKILSHFMKQ